MASSLEFAAGRNLEYLGSLAELDIGHLSIKPGAYVLVAERTQFQYPLGVSSIFYIGKASRLRRRLRQHHKAIEEATKHRCHPIYRPVTEYAAKFGATVFVFETEEQRGEAELEFLLLAEFLVKFRGLPIANNAVNWRRVREHLKKLGMSTAE